MSSSAPDRAGPPSHPHEDINRAVAFKKVLRELGSNTRSRSATTGGRDDSELMVTEVETEGLVFVGRRGGGEQHRGPRCDTDGGTRLAGERPGEVVMDDFDQRSMSEGSTLPPPYASDFGEA